MLSMQVLKMYGFFSRTELLSNVCKKCFRKVLPRHSRSYTTTKTERTGKGAVKLAFSSFHQVNAPEKGPPLVIIHGLLGSRRNWESLAKAFSKTGRKVVTVDCRNHGESPHTEEMDYHVMSQDLQLLLEEMDMDSVVLLGHSMGGKVAMTLALEQPNLVSKLIVEDVSPDVSRSVETSLFPTYLSALKNIPVNVAGSLAEARRLGHQELASLIPENAVRNFVLTNLEMRDGEIQWKINIDAIMNNLDALVAFPVFNTCYMGDTTFIGGAKSQHISAKHMPEIKRLFPEATVQHIIEAGHWVHSQKPYEFFNAVIKFLDGKNIYDRT